MLIAAFAFEQHRGRSAGHPADLVDSVAPGYPAFYERMGKDGKMRAVESSVFESWARALIARLPHAKEEILAVLNGAVGDRLADADSKLAISMELFDHAVIPQS